MSSISPTVLSGVDTQETINRQVPKQDFAKVLKDSLATTTRVLANGVAVASPELDVSRSIVSTMSRGLSDKSTEIHNKDILKSEESLPSGKDGAENTGVQSTSDLLSATKALQEANWQFSLEYLALQEKVQNENRYFSTVSNIMRTRHDSAKNAINNLR